VWIDETRLTYEVAAMAPRTHIPNAMGEISVSEPRRKRFLSLKDRLALYASEVRGRASLLPAGIEKDALLKKADQAETQSDIDDWTRLAGSRPPKK
jgi:hypothetical protein